MLVSLEWIRELIDIRMSVEEAGHILTMLGLEVEGLEASGEDYVFEVNVTPNRPDCLSMLGIARELSASTGLPIKLPDSKVKDEGQSSFKIEILDTSLCPRYAGRVIREVPVGESPGWIRDRLEKCGIRSINNIVDITNYVLLEMGHPLHAFDLDTLRGNIIKVGTAGEGRNIVTLDGIERKLPPEALLIWDSERPVAVAGVMGGADTEVTEATKNIFIESAYFKPKSVRRTSKALGLKTEASFRFERGADIVALEHALDRASLLVLETAGGRAERKVDAYPQMFSPSRIEVRHEKVNRVLGTSLTNKEMEGLIGRLGLEVKAGSKSFTVVQPPSRPDLTIDADIIEEIARLYGYQNIPTALPRAKVATPGRKPYREFISSVKETMRKGGYNEAVSYSFMNLQQLDALGIPKDDKRRRCVGIQNPLRKEDAFLRTMLAPSLIEMFTHNFFRGVRDVRLFEVSRVFEETGDNLPSERMVLGGVYCIEDKKELWKDNTEGFYVVKGTIESLLAGLGIEQYSFVASTEPFLHTGKSSDIVLENTKAGYMGVLSPKVIEGLDIKSKPEVIVFELALEELLKNLPSSSVYTPIPRYPYIERDAAVLIDGNTPASAITDAIRSFDSDLVEDTKIFDLYEGDKLPEGTKSIAFSVRYRAEDRTLTDEEAGQIHDRLLEHLRKTVGAEARR